MSSSISAAAGALPPPLAPKVDRPKDHDADDAKAGAPAPPAPPPSPTSKEAARRLDIQA